jgi:hypothetical protein
MQSHCKRVSPIMRMSTKKWVNKSKLAQVDGSQPPSSNLDEVKESLDPKEGCLAQTLEAQAQPNSSPSKNFVITLFPSLYTLASVS